MPGPLATALIATGAVWTAVDPLIGGIVAAGGLVVELVLTLGASIE